ncbi:hypothetical protein BDQ12DRAFT_676678 [Crucibulum laeve]|uniref:Uncharacterized protein n=1 Tax=Crucibulum laeve TaxID=68775 RepID=A0A5C3MNG2_9AGAR|nr:hypothetical protein BDQ12DRAFT_676678 [Crucibulum laeve]
MTLDKVGRSSNGFSKNQQGGAINWTSEALIEDQVIAPGVPWTFVYIPMYYEKFGQASSLPNTTKQKVSTGVLDSSRYADHPAAKFMYLSWEYVIRAGPDSGVRSRNSHYPSILVRRRIENG